MGVHQNITEQDSIQRNLIDGADGAINPPLDFMIDLAGGYAVARTRNWLKSPWASLIS